MLKHSRREFLASVGGAALSLSGARSSLAAQTQVNVGFSLAMSGPAAAIGESVWRGASLYSKLNQNKLPTNVALDVTLRDDGGSSDNIKRIAQEFIVRDHVKVLAGVALSPQAFTLAPLVTQAKTPLVVMNASTASITRESPYIVRTSTTLWQTGYTMGKWAAANGHKRVYTLVSDYAAGVDAETAFVTAFKDNGGEVVGGVRTPVVTTDYLPYMQNIKASGADTIFMFVIIGRVASAVAAYGGAGLKQAGIRLIGPGDIAPDDEILHADDSILGLVTAGIYYAQNPTPANKEFVAAWKAEYGTETLPNYIAVAGWDGMTAIYDLARATGGDFTPDQAMQFLSTWKNPNSPRGPISIDPETRDIVQTIYINRVEMVDGKPTSVNFAKIDAVSDPWKELNPPK